MNPRRRRIGSAGFARRFRPKDAPKRRRRSRRSGVGDGSGRQGPQGDRLRVEPRARQSLRDCAGRGGLRRDDQRPRCGAARRDGEGDPRRDRRRGRRRRRRPRRSGDARRAVRRLSRARHSRQQQWRAAADRVRRSDARDDPRRARSQHADADRADPARAAGHGGAPLRPHRQHHLVLGARAARRPRRLVGRARRPHRLRRRQRARLRQAQRHHQFDPARRVRHRPHPRHPRQGGGERR